MFVCVCGGGGGGLRIYPVHNMKCSRVKHTNRTFYMDVGSTGYHKKWQMLDGMVMCSDGVRQIDRWLRLARRIKIGWGHPKARLGRTRRSNSDQWKVMNTAQTGVSP